MNRNILAAMLVKTEAITLECLKGTVAEKEKFTLGQLTIAESKKYNDLRKSAKKRYCIDMTNNPEPLYNN